MSTTEPARHYHVHHEPADLKHVRPEACSKCGQSTRYWLTPHVPLCRICADKPGDWTPPKHDMKKAKTTKPRKKTYTFRGLKQGDRVLAHPKSMPEFKKAGTLKLNVMSNDHYLVFDDGDKIFLTPAFFDVVPSPSAQFAALLIFF